MKKVLLKPVVAAALFAAACGGDGATTVDTRAQVRFFNATAEMSGSGGFTTNGQFATGSALAFGQSSQTCSRVDAGSTAFGFGAANTAGTALSGNALATLNNQSITSGGNFTVVATGTAASPTLFLLDNSFPGSLGNSQAAVRFVNLAPGTGTAATNLFVVKGAFPGPFIHSNIPLGAATTFNAVASGSHEYTILRGHDTVVSGSAATLNFQPGTVNTIALVQNASGGFELINIPRC